MRSLLFIPADDEKKLAKGVASGADALILDLEDAVSAARKAAARAHRRALHRRQTRAQAPAAASTCASTRSIRHLWEDDLAGVMAQPARRHPAAQGALGRGRAHAVHRARSRGGASRRRRASTRIIALVDRDADLAAAAARPTSALERAARWPDLGRGGSLRGARRAHQSRGRRPRLDLALPAGARSVPVHGRRGRRAADRYRVRQFPRRGGPARRKRAPPRATASPARWRSIPTRWR